MSSSSPATNPTSTPATSQGPTPQNGKKRKSPSQLALLRKRIRQNLITCPVAISILRDLGLRSRTTLNSGKFLAWTVDPTDPIFQTIHSYVSKGIPGKVRAVYHPPQFGTKILGILRISPASLPPQFDDNPNNRGQLRMMLWKGCRTIDARNVFKNGLKFQKANKYQYFGPGYYFCDRIDSALEWSWDTRYIPEGEQVTDVFRKDNVAYLFLCEVLVGNDVYLTNTTEPEAPLVTPKQSLWAKWTNQPAPPRVKVKTIKYVGCWNPDPNGHEKIEGCVWPVGKNNLSLRRGFAGAFWGNLHVVYDQKRVIPRYLVKVQVTEVNVKEKIC